MLMDDIKIDIAWEISWSTVCRLTPFFMIMLHFQIALILH